MMNSILKDASLIIALLLVAYWVFTLILIITENREPASTFAWVIVLWLLPIIGLLVYIFFGRNWRVRSKTKMLAFKHIENKIEQSLAFLSKKEDDRIEELLMRDPSFRTKKLQELLDQSSGPESILTSDNTVQILQNGSEKFPTLIEDLKKAKQYIHMEYFIWRSDELTNKVKDILIEKAKEGVEIRIVFDPLGAFLTKRSHINEMRRAGIEMKYFFNTLAPLKITTVNYLLHRKIIVIDGRVGYTGGMNMGQEYIDGGKDYDAWRDTHLKIIGESVQVLQSMFAENWNQMSGKDDLFDKKYFPKLEPSGGNVPIQMTASGPSTQWDSLRQLFFSMIMFAWKKVYIQSPYFVPDPSVYEALKVAALSGVDVRVMVTGVPDKKIAYWTAFTYMEELLRAGVRFFHYNAGFMHAKTINVDTEICTIGTTNLDIRSFHIAHEVNAVMFDKKTAKELEEDFRNDLKACKEFTLKNYQALGKVERFRNSLVRLLSPLM